MPFVSQAQKRRAEKLLESGEIDQDTFDRWNEGTPDDLPERLRPHRERDPAKAPKGQDPDDDSKPSG